MNEPSEQDSRKDQKARSDTNLALETDHLCGGSDGGEASFKPGQGAPLDHHWLIQALGGKRSRSLGRSCAATTYQINRGRESPRRLSAQLCEIKFVQRNIERPTYVDLGEFQGRPHIHQERRPCGA